MNKEKKENILDLDEVNRILSETLLKVSEKQISLKRAQSITRIALALSKNITNIELKNRVEFLEQVFKKRI